MMISKNFYVLIIIQVVKRGDIGFQFKENIQQMNTRQPHRALIGSRNYIQFWLRYKT